MFPGGILPPDYDPAYDESAIHRGIYFPYGDLNDVVEELLRDPTTRQAILPVFFPETQVIGQAAGNLARCSITSCWSTAISTFLTSCARAISPITSETTYTSQRVSSCGCLTDYVP
jgi:hypothetical protein